MKITADIIAILIALFALLVAVYQWLRQRFFDRRAIVSSVFEELRHNLNLTELFIGNGDLDVFLKYASCRLSELDQWAVYPNPTDSTECREEQWRLLEDVHRLPLPLNNDEKLMNFRSNAVEMSLSTGQMANVGLPRLFINMGHLHYSLVKINRTIDIINNSLWNIPEGSRIFREHLRNLKSEYIDWLHFRLVFAYIDMIENTPIRYFADKSYIKKTKGKFKSSEIMF